MNPSHKTVRVEIPGAVLGCGATIWSINIERGVGSGGSGRRTLAEN